MRPFPISTAPLLLLAATLTRADLPPLTLPDTITMHHHTPAGIPVLRNDSGPLDPTTLAITTAPRFGSATPRPDGTILYTHTSATPPADILAYTIADFSGNTSAPALVTITFSTNLRLPNTTAFMPGAPPSSLYQIVDAFPGVTFSAPTSMESPPGDTNRLFVCERGGRISVIPNVTATAPTQTLFLDLSARVEDDGGELGLKGIAFHPGYQTNRIFYVTYCTVSNATRYVCLSRFKTLAQNPNAANTNSEKLLIRQQNDNVMHNIDDAAFGPDGYLYVAFGDEGPQADGNGNSQRIDKDIWSALLRIDVDGRPGSLAPNPHASIVTNAQGQPRFAIPPDNPFIGTTQFNGVTVDPAQVRTEFYAVGFRNPWQFSFDPLTGDLWLGDVGFETREEIDIIVPGKNYGWVYFEGTQRFGPWDLPEGFNPTPPVWDYPHASGSFSGYSVTAGLVYHGTRYPHLDGKFLCADFVTGNLWSLTRTDDATNVVRFAGETGIVQFGRDPANGDILLLDHDGRVCRLLLPPGAESFPQTLGATGFFADLATLSPNPGVVPYEPNLSFWSDYAIKHRWFVLPNLEDRVGYAPEGAWTLPAGMIWLKHFELERHRGNPASRTRIETRVLVRTTNSLYGVSYRWNDEGTEAFLAPDTGEEITLAITNQFGEPATQHWKIPSRAECLSCHRANTGRALSFNTRQLNRDGTLGGATGNFLALLAQAGYVSNAIPAPATLPRHVRPDETAYSLEARARAYLAVNCAQCHQPGAFSGAPATWDARPQLTLPATKLVNGLPANNGGNPTNRLVLPGDPAHSVLVNRIGATNGFSRMPPLATSELDTNAIALLADWITQQLPSWQPYPAWRLAHFGDTNAPAGNPTADPDADGARNDQEFFTFTDPNTPDPAWSATIDVVSNDLVEIRHNLPNRHVFVEAGTNLVDWETWDAPGNDGLPLAPNTTHTITAPAPGPPGFFRFRIEEN